MDFFIGDEALTAAAGPGMLYNLVGADLIPLADEEQVMEFTIPYGMVK